MDDVSEFLLGPQRSSVSGFGIVLSLIAVALAGALMIYLLRCYLQERRIRKRIQRRTQQQFGGNIVPPELMPSKVLSQTRRFRKKSSGILPAPHRVNDAIKLRRRSRGMHPWKQNRFRADSATPH